MASKITPADLPTSTATLVCFELDDGTQANVELRADGTFYGDGQEFDFSAPDAAAMAAKLNAWGARVIGWESNQ